MFLGSRSRAPDGGENPAAGAGDLLVRSALQALLEFVRAVAGVYEMRVAVDEPRGDPCAVRIVVLARPSVPVGTRADPGDQAISYGNYAILDRTVRSAFAHGREIGVDQGGIVHLVIIAG